MQAQECDCPILAGAKLTVLACLVCRMEGVTGRQLERQAQVVENKKTYATKLEIAMKEAVDVSGQVLWTLCYKAGMLWCSGSMPACKRLFGSNSCPCHCLALVVLLAATWSEHVGCRLHSYFTRMRLLAWHACNTCGLESTVWACLQLRQEAAQREAYFGNFAAQLFRTVRDVNHTQWPTLFGRLMGRGYLQFVCV